MENAPVRQLQENVCARLRALPGLGGCAVVPAADGGADDISRRLAAALARAGARGGAALVVSVPGGSLRRNASGLARLDPARVEVAAFTRPRPGAGRTPADLALLAAAALAGWTPPGCRAPLSADGELRCEIGDAEASASVRLSCALDLPAARLGGERAFAPSPDGDGGNDNETKGTQQ